MHYRQTLRLLGDFRVTVDDEPVYGRVSPRVQTLLTYVVLHADEAVSRQRVAFDLWPDSNDVQARTNLRKLLHELRSSLPDADDCLISTNTTLQWNAHAPYSVDVVLLREALAQADHDPDDLDAHRRVGELYTGELLPRCYDDWVAPLRAELQRAVHDTLSRLADKLEVARAYDDAVRYARQLAELDPLDEIAAQRLMRLYLLNGDRARALNAYRHFAADLERELGVEPSDATKLLYEQCTTADAYRAKGNASRPATEPGNRLVGRQSEWQKLRSAWQHALAGNARLVAIAGEAGIGKTRLAEELLTWARRQGYRAERTRSYAAQGSLALAPLAELLRSDSLRAGLDELDDVWLSEIARLVPSVLNGRPQASPPQPMAESWQRHRFFDAVARGVLAAEEPLLLLFDDLQWCDDETLEWLGFLLHREPEAPLLVMATVRTDEIDRGHGYGALANTLSHSDQYQEILLRPLDNDETTELGSQVAGHEFSSLQANRLYVETQGNPLFVVETVRAEGVDGADRTLGLTGASGIGPGVANLPAKMYAVIRARLALLSPRAQDLASLAAVAGRSFSYDVLHEASGQDHTTLTGGVEELLQRRIIVHRSEDVYDFSHDRIRDVVYAEISSVRRRLLHDQMAQALVQRYSADLDSVSGELAEHYQQAGRKQEAVEYLLRAGDVSARQFANQQALDYYDRAQALLPDNALPARYDLLTGKLDIYWRTEGLTSREAEMEELARVVDALQAGPADKDSLLRRADLALRQSQSAYYAGLMDECILRSREAMRYATDADATDIYFTACSIAGNAYWALGEMQKSRDVMLEPLERALAEDQADTAAHLMAKLAATGMFSGMPTAEILAYIERFLALYERTGNLVGQAEGHNKLGYLAIHGFEGVHEEACRHFARAIELSEEAGSTFWLSNAESNLGYTYILQGNYGAAQRHLARAQGIAEEIDYALRIGTGHVYLGYEQRNRGDLQSALSSQGAALEVLARIRLPLWGTWAHRELALVHRALGELGPAEDQARQAIEVARKFGDTRQEGYALTALGLTLENQGCPEAAEIFRQAIDCYVAMELFNRSMAPLAGLARMAAAAGDDAQASSYVGRILNHLEAHALDKTEEGYRVYVSCYQLLQGWGDPRAADCLATAQEHLRVRAASLTEVDHLRLFWNMADHREIRDADRAGADRRTGRSR